HSTISCGESTEVSIRQMGSAVGQRGKLEFERLAIRVVLTRAIAFSPTIVTLEKATLVGNRLYLVLFLTDEDGDTSVSTLPGLMRHVKILSTHRRRLGQLCSAL